MTMTHAFRSSVGAHVLLVDGSRIYDVDEATYAACADGGLSPALRDQSKTRFVTEEPLRPQSLRALSLTIAQSCNMACSYCYADEGRFGSHARLMSKDVAIRAVDAFIAQVPTGRDAVLGFMGGEPFLNAATLHAATHHAARLAQDRDIRLRFSVTTNATLLTDADVALLGSYPFSVAVSLDGGRRTNDLQRRLRNGQSAYERVLDGIERLVTAKPRPHHVSLRATVTPRSDRLIDMLETMLTLGVDEVGFAPVLVSPKPADAFGADDFQSLLEQMRTCGAAAKSALLRRQKFAFSNFETALLEIHKGTHRPYPCGAAAGYASVSAEGNLFGCHRAIDDPRFAIGSIDKGPSQAARDAFLAERHVLRQEPCKTCWPAFCAEGDATKRPSHGAASAATTSAAGLSTASPPTRNYQQAFPITSSIQSVFSAGRTPRPPMSHDLISRKIQPRNLTARADHWVRGNPVTTRPESGVDNCYPGLEFDQRNLDKQFFPGLEFEFHLGTFPPLLRAFDSRRAGRDLPLRREDLGAAAPEALFLWAVLGTFGTMTGPTQRLERFGGQTGAVGLSAWRVVHDLEPGAVAVLLAPGAVEGGIALDATQTLEAETALHSGNDLVQRDDAGRLIFAVLIGARAPYLIDGVINPLLYEPGDLTRSLCAPWQYDFTDCGCFYWASNKPDLVAVQQDGPQLYNFQRARRGDAGERPVADILADKTGLLTITGWDNRGESGNRILSYQELINDWQLLTPVFEATEARHFTPQPRLKLPASDVLSRAEALRRLRYLATVEHGLMIEYLYAHYSVNAPRTLPKDDHAAALNYDVARSILSVAIDEMRHFRWVNEILRELGQPLELGRVAEFQDIDNDQRFIPHSFALRALTSEQLAWFIEVEKPSDQVDPERAADTIDGLYTRLLLSIAQSDEFSQEERGRLAHLIKLIIDEGFDHYSRFSNIQATLSGSTESWLRPSYPDQPLPLPDGHAGKVAELVADRAYRTVLTTLGLVFSTSNRRTGEFLQAARFAMYALDDAAHEAIRRGGAPLFTLPSRDEVAPSLQSSQTQTPRDWLESAILGPMLSALDELSASGSPGTAASMRSHYQKLVTEMARLL